MDEKRLLEGLASLEGFIIPSTPQSGPGGVPCSEPRRHSTDRGLAATPTSQPPYRADLGSVPAQPVDATSRPSCASLQPASTAPTLAFFLQLPPTPQQSLIAAVIPQTQPQASQPKHGNSPFIVNPAVGTTAPSSAEQRVLRLTPGAVQTIGSCLSATAGDTAAVACPRVARKAVLLLTSPATTHAALAQLNALALASDGRAALAALQPMPLVARVFARAFATGDHVGSERAAAVLRALLAEAQLHFSHDAAGLLMIPTAVQLLGGTGATAAVAAAAVAAAAAAADASGTLSCTSLHVRLRSYPTAAAPAHPPPQHSFPHAAAPVSCRLASTRLLLHLATMRAPSATAPMERTAHGGPWPNPGATSTGPGVLCDRLVSAGALEACCEALSASAACLSAAEAELQCCTLQLLAALTADVTGWPWQWPVVRAAAVAGCARQAVALMRLLDSSGLGFAGDWTTGGYELGAGDDDGGLSGEARLEAEAHAAARSVVVHLSRGPLLVREALVQAGVLSAVVEAIMMWPPPLPSSALALPVGLPMASTAAAASAAATGARHHFSLCLGVLLNLSSLPRVRATLASPELGPLLGHLLGLLEQQPWETAPGGAGSCPLPDVLPAAVPAAVPGPSEVRGTLLELLLNFALDPQCHAGLAAQGVAGLLVRCISAEQQVKLEPGPGPSLEALAAGGDHPQSSWPRQNQQQQAPQSYQQPWRAAAALRLVAALAADPQFSVPRSAMQRALASVGGLEVVAHEVQSAAEALSVHGAAAAYDLSMTALCALMTGTGDLQRRVAGMPELLTALSAALPHPVVARSDARLRITLAAWRLITAPLAAPGADQATAQTLLTSLGHNSETMRPSTILGGGIGGSELSTSRSRPLFDPAARPRSRQPRQSVLLTAAELRGRLSSASGGGSFSGPRLPLDPPRASGEADAEPRVVQASVPDRDEVESLATTPTAGAPAVGTSRAPTSWFSSGAKGTAWPAGPAALPDADAADVAGAPTPPVWTGPLLPGTPLPPPGTPPPDVSPLRLPSCVVASPDSRPGSSKPGAMEGGLGRPMSRSRSSRRPSRTAESPGQRQGLQPHRSVFTGPPDSNDDCKATAPVAPAASLSDIGLARRSVSNRLAATPLSSSTAAASGSSPVPLLPPSGEPSPPLSPDGPHLPGAMPPPTTQDENAEGGCDSNRRRPHSSKSVGAEASGADESGPARGGEADVAPRTSCYTGNSPRPPSSSAASASRSGPSTTIAMTLPGTTTRVSTVPPTPVLLPSPRDTSSRSSSSSSALSIVSPATGQVAATEASAPSADIRDPAALTAGVSGPASSLAVNPALEMSPPLLCLVTHLQALLSRPACRAVAALVLVQLARLEVVRRSAVMGAGWGALMEAVTSSLTASGERSAAGSQGQSAVGPCPSNTAASAAAAAAVDLPTDPRDKLALLEVMDVAASSAVEGRAALTAPSVVSVLTDLCCGRGSLAASLLRSEDPMTHPHRGLLLRPFRHHHHRRHDHHRHDQSSSGDDHQLQMEQQLQQPYLTRARTLAMEILGELLRGEQPRAAGQLQEGLTGAVFAEQLVHALSTAAEAADAVASLRSLELGSAPGLLAQEQRRQRHAAALLLRRLATSVGCAREFLARPGLVATLLELLASLWDTHAPALVPAAASALMSRAVGLTASSYNGLTLSRASRAGGPPSAAAVAMETNGGISASTSESNLVLANRRSSNLHADSHLRLTFSGGGGGGGGGGGNALLAPPPSFVAAAAGGGGPTSPLGRPAPLLTSLSPVLNSSPSADLSQEMRLSITVGARPVSGLGGAAPHSVRTRMSLHSAVCTDTAQWTSPAQQAMKALEMSGEREQVAPMGPVSPYYRHAHTHTGSTVPLRPSPLSANKRSGGAGPGVDGMDAEAAEAGSDSELSCTDEFMMLKGVAPPPPKKPTPQSARTGEGVHAQQQLPTPPRLRGLTGGSRGGRMAEVAFAAAADGGSGVGGAHGGDAEGSGAADDPDGQNLMCNTVLRRGTRALAPPAAPGAVLPAGAAVASSTGAAASAAQCASELLKLLTVLADGDPDAARSMSTLPAVELFVDLLASTNSELVLATLALLERLAERQDAHETFWDCDAVAQLVAHLQMRSAAAAAAASAAAAAAPDCTARHTSGDAAACRSGADGDAHAAADESAAVARGAQLQLGAARVLDRLCCDPDLHGRLAATELPAALMALVKRGADQAQATGQITEKATTRPLSPAPSVAAAVCAALASSSLLSCILHALVSLLECADVRRQARERRLPLHLGVLAGSGCGDPGVLQLASLCGEKLREAPPRLRPDSMPVSPATWGNLPRPPAPAAQVDRL